MDTLIHRWFEDVWNQGRESVIDELTTEDAISHGLSTAEGDDVRGPATFKPFYRRLKAAFPDIHFTVEDALSDGNKIAARVSVTGTHTGLGLSMPPTNRPVQLHGMVIARTKDGKIAEVWNNFDFLSLYQQIGLKLV
jgi:predicted ester cyclase